LHTRYPASARVEDGVHIHSQSVSSEKKMQRLVIPLQHIAAVGLSPVWIFVSCNQTCFAPILLLVVVLSLRKVGMNGIDQAHIDILGI
jgi:hypothetical protein